MTDTGNRPPQGEAGASGQESETPRAGKAPEAAPVPPAPAAAKTAAARKPRKPRPKALINENGCTGCEACITVCPVDCIVKIPNPAQPEMNPICRVDWDRCTGCTICARDCPWETIDMLLPNQGDIAERIQRYSLEEYGDQFIPEPQLESAA